MNPTQSKRRVLVVDDSALVRQILTEILNKHPHLEVVGQASDPYEAREKVISLHPDVLTLDVEMPRMDGVTFLGKLMKARPTPVVMVSSLTDKGTATALEALSRGAIEVIGKPTVNMIQGLEGMGDSLAEAVYEASFAKLKAPSAEAPQTTVKLSADSVLPPLARRAKQALGPNLIAIGSSTGGTEALREIFEALPEGLPPVLVVQHMLPGFTTAFAERLNRLCRVRVKEAEHGETPEPGSVYLAPSDVHLSLKARGSNAVMQLIEGPRVSRHLPSVDVLFRSVAQTCGANALGVILTGMGDDGAAGLLEMRQAGSATLGQDEATCVVYGMPRMAFQKGAVERQLPLRDIPAHVVRWAQSLT